MRSLTNAVAVVDALTAFTPRASYSQQPILVSGYDEVPSSEFELYLDRPSAYAGEYHFGDSEGESSLHLTVTGDRVTGRLTRGDFRNNAWGEREIRLEGGRIVGAMLVAPEWSGVFVRMGRQKGLVLFRAPAEFIGTEFGAKLPWVRDE